MSSILFDHLVYSRSPQGETMHSPSLPHLSSEGVGLLDRILSSVTYDVTAPIAISFTDLVRLIISIVELVEKRRATEGQNSGALYEDERSEIEKIKAVLMSPIFQGKK